jgi:hypothetical protein
MNSIDVTAALKRTPECTTYFCSVVDNDKPRYVRFRLLTPDGKSWNYKARLDSRAWLSGREIDEKGICRLDTGLHTLMIQLSVGTVESWGKIWIAPRFTDVSEEYEKKMATYQKVSAGWPEYQESLKQLLVLKAESPQSP